MKNNNKKNCNSYGTVLNNAWQKDIGILRDEIIKVCKPSKISKIKRFLNKLIGRLKK